MNETNLVLIIMIVGFAALAYLQFRKKDTGKNEDVQGLVLLQSQLNDLAKTIDAKLGESRQEMSLAVKTQFTESQKLLDRINLQMMQSLKEVTIEQTKTNEATRQFVTIAEQLGNLEKVLKHQKERGNLGERSLELILTNMLPPTGFAMQHRFKNGEAVDAVIKTKEGLVPVDAKFSLDNYNRILNSIDEHQKIELEKEFKNDLKKRIDETAKYIRPEEGTLPIAFMFIPAEAIYYDLLVNEVGAVKVNTKNLVDYALNDKKVIIVSPTTLAAYLQTVLYGFKAFRIEQQATEIMKNVNELGRHMKAYEDFVLKLGNSLSTTVNHYNSASKEFKKVDKDIYKIAGVAVGVELPRIESPRDTQE